MKNIVMTNYTKNLNWLLFLIFVIISHQNVLSQSNKTIILFDENNTMQVKNSSHTVVGRQLTDDFAEIEKG